MESKRKVLYVDDEEINLKLFKLSLRRNFDVITVSSAIEGLEVLEKDTGIDIVVSDLKMPVMNGLDFITRIKEGSDRIVCILLSGYAESETIMEGFNRNHIFQYLLKPWNREQLIVTIDEAFTTVKPGP